MSFKYKDYRADGHARYKTMTLPAHEFIRRFLMHVLPPGFHRIRHYGLFANGGRVANIARVRELLAVPTAVAEPAKDEDGDAAMFPQPCPSCGGRMIVIETFAPGDQPSRRSGPDPPTCRIDNS